MDIDIVFISIWQTIIYICAGFIDQIPIYVLI